ncbi:MAG: outer membrane beta-barrel protein [Vibrio sp.]
MKKTILALALIGASTSAFADSWIYGGASVGTAKIDGVDGTAYNIHAGTGLLPIIGVEAGLNKFDSFDHRSDLSFNDTYIALKPSINFGPLQVYAKGGLHKWDKDSDNGSDDGYDVMYSVGADYEVFGPISVGANYSNYKMDHDDMETYNLTVSFNIL